MNDEQKGIIAVGFGLVALAFIIIGGIQGAHEVYFKLVNPLLIIGGLFGLLFFVLLFGFRWVGEEG